MRRGKNEFALLPARLVAMGEPQMLIPAGIRTALLAPNADGKTIGRNSML
jgi:hypothetical protein